MKTQGQSLFIISSQPQQTLQQNLTARFGLSLEIHVFTNPELALRKIDATTEFIVLDSSPTENLNSHLLQRIKQLNPKTEVIVLTSDDNVSKAIHLFREGASDVVLKGKSLFHRIADKIAFILLQPLRLIQSEFRVRKFLSIQFIVFFTLGLIAIITIIYSNYSK